MFTDFIVAFVSSQKDYVCFDVVPRHHNVIRYRKGIAVIKDDFSTVCSWVQFPNKEEWKYDLFLCKQKRKRHIDTIIQ